jgi:ribosomal protein L37AE/L43A
MSDDPNYHCEHCGTTWSYRAVRYAARCRDCGTGLTRVAPAPAAAAVAAVTTPSSAAPSPPPRRRAAA